MAAAFVAGPAVAHAAPPANDNFANAITLPLDTNVQGSTIDATAEAGEQNIPGVNPVSQDCAAISDDSHCTSSVWYRFEVPSTGTYTVETCDLSTEVDSIMGIWTGATPATLAIVDLGGMHPASSDDECAGGFGRNGSQVTFTANSGTTYWVEIAGFESAEGFFWLRAYSGSPKPSPPEPDTFVGHNNSFPTGLINGGPSASGPRPTASFDFYSDEAGATFQCSFDGSAFAACTSPISLDGVTSGTHSFVVRSVVGGIPDPTPNSQIYTIDNSPPDTALVSAPPSSTSNTEADFRTQGSERAYYNEFDCGLDSQPADSTCGPAPSYSALCNGVHTFRSAFIDNANNLDPTPVTTSFTETGAGSTCAAPKLGSLTLTSDSPTREGFQIPYTPTGAGGTLTLEYGTTTAYGETSDDDVVDPAANNSDPGINYLLPGTLYHYKVTITTPFGSDTTGDQTFTTPPLGGANLPTVTVGTPVVVGTHAAAIPITATAGDHDADFGIFVDNRGPASPNSSPSFEPFSPTTATTGGGPVTTVVDLVDLEPGVYHVRGFASEDFNPSNTVLGPDFTFTVGTTPAGGGPPPQSPPLAPFKLRAGFIKIGKFNRHSKTLTFVVSHLPPSTSVGVTVRATLARHASVSKVKLLGRGKAKAGKGGVARVKVKLGRKARKVLLNKRTKSLSLSVRVKPPSQSASSITLHRRLKG